MATPTAARVALVALAFAVLVAGVSATRSRLKPRLGARDTPNPIVDIDDLLVVVNTTSNGRLLRINHPVWSNNLPVVQLWGTAEV